MDLLYQIRTRLDEFSKTEQRIARLILEDVGFAAGASQEALAERTGASPATLSRFARRLGCRDLRELRLRLAQASAVGTRFLAADTAPAASSFFGQIVGDIEQSLRQHLAGFDEARFAAAVALLRSATMIHAFGTGGCSTLCSQELQHRLVRLGYPIAACHDPVLMRLTAATLGPEQTLLVCSLTGRTPEVLAAVTLARAYGTRVVALTGADTPLAEHADVLLPLHSAETDFIFKPTAARYGMLLAIDVLATELALAAPQANQERLRRIKLALDDYRGGNDRQPLGD